MTDYKIFSPVQSSEHCYLSELLYWRGFGRLPEDVWDLDRPWRFSENVRDNATGPVPEASCLSEQECLFAGIPIDPRTKWEEQGDLLPDSEDCRKQLAWAETHDPPITELIEEYKRQIDLSVLQEAEASEWTPYFNDYTDEFKAELLLDLRRGKLRAYGSSLPCSTVEQSLEFLEEKDAWLDSLSVELVPGDAWISTYVDWEESLIEGGRLLYIWIHFRVAEMLELYPPTALVKEDSRITLGGSIAIVGAAGATAKGAMNRGRPALPWDQLHVEVARVYARGELPVKKEAAIIHFQEWFLTKYGKSVSRSAIGQRLKPYYDGLQITDRK